MRIKIKDTWYECEDDQPMMIELNKRDKENISNMAKEATRYAIFTDTCPLTTDEKVEWMK